MSPTARVSAVGLGTLAVMLAVFLVQPVAFERIERVTLDWRFQLRGPMPPESPSLWHLKTSTASPVQSS